MRTKFLHMADCHLGYRQYNLHERFNDFGRAFHHVINVAIAEKVDFVQVVKVKGTAKTNLAGKVEFMVCNDEKCLPPAEVDFNVNIGG